jgi:hypothetical protein
MPMSDGKYRLRTALREALPQRLAVLIAKGSDDCGNHEWYKSEERTWRCYHCTPGITHDVPWSLDEIEARRCEAEASLLRAGLRSAAAPRHPAHR